MLANGVCEEQARIVLPQAAMTTWIWSGSLYAFARVVALRTSPDAQAETREVATQIKSYLQELFPVSMKALTHASKTD
jgi:thymidylate synthase (FAD)